MAADKKIEGVTVRHARKCEHGAGRCTCTPTFQAHALVRGVRQRKTFDNLIEAKNWRSDLLRAVRRGEPIASPGRRTLGDAIDDFTAALESGTALKRGNRPYKPSVARAYIYDLDGRVKDSLGHVRLSDLQRGDIQSFIEGLGKDGLGASRIRGIVTATQAMLRREIRAQRMAANPAADLDLPALPTPDETVLSPDQTDDLIAALPVDEQLLWALAGWAGLRRAEIRALRVCDVDTDANVIRVTRAMDDSGVVVEPKSRRGRRDVPLAPQLRALVKEHTVRTGRRDTDLLCGRTRTELFTPTHIAKQAQKAWTATNAKRKEKKQTPLPIVGLHRFRHSWISAMLAAGMPVASVALWAGHDVKVMTEVYLHAIPGRGHEDGDLIGQVFAARQSRDNPTPELAVLSGS